MKGKKKKKRITHICILWSQFLFGEKGVVNIPLSLHFP